MSTVTITDEATRTVLVRAAWAAAVSVLGNCDGYWSGIEHADGEFIEQRREIGGRVEMYLGAVTLVDEIEAAEIGATVKIDAETERYLRDLCQTVRECSDMFFGAEKSERQRMLERYDAAEVLFPAEAVA